LIRVFDDIDDIDRPDDRTTRQVVGQIDAKFGERGLASRCSC
jgi:hypothetical protein